MKENNNIAALTSPTTYSCNVELSSYTKTPPINDTPIFVEFSSSVSFFFNILSYPDSISFSVIWFLPLRLRADLGLFFSIDIRNYIDRKICFSLIGSMVSSHPWDYGKRRPRFFFWALTMPARPLFSTCWRTRFVFIFPQIFTFFRFNYLLKKLEYGVLFVAEIGAAPADPTSHLGGIEHWEN